MIVHVAGMAILRGMSVFQLIVLAVAAVMLFLYALRGFSRELQHVGGERLPGLLQRWTDNRYMGFLLGALATAILQSSSAVSAILVAFVDANVITFRQSLAVLLGTNVGTTSTAWLVSFKLTGIGPIMIVLAGVISLLPSRLKVFGQAIFYFGLIFFTLDLLSGALQPLRDQPVFMAWLAKADNVWVALLFGVVFTAAVQSSSVAIGVCILFVQQGLLPVSSAVAIVVGANLGTTSTALMASLALSKAAKATAGANLLFNACGVVLFLPFIHWFGDWLAVHVQRPELAVALAHLVFNVAVALLFLLFLGPVVRFLENRLYPQATEAATPLP